MNKRGPDPDRPPPTPAPPDPIGPKPEGCVDRCLTVFGSGLFAYFIILCAWAVLKRYGFTE